MPTKTQKKKPLKKTVIIKKSRWSRLGTSKGCRKPGSANYLQCNDGKKCCLGFICVQSLGCKKNDILFEGMDPRLCGDGLCAPNWYVERNKKAADINDDEETSDTGKIRLLNKLFDKSPIRLKFIP